MAERKHTGRSKSEPIKVELKQNYSKLGEKSGSPGTLPPALYLVATPIGNMGDMTFRAVETLRGVDLILCEDTRVTRKLLSHYDIHVPVGVYNDLSEGRDPDFILDQIAGGKSVALVSDAGMPLISDPGYKLVRGCAARGIRVTSVPGANAVLTALQLSGLPTDAFLFLGFLATKSSARRAALADVATVPATIICYERADRVAGLLADVQAAMGGRAVAVARELTKLFEDVRRGSVADVLAGLEANPIKGEVVVLIDRAGADTQEELLSEDERIIAALRERIAAGDRMRAAVDAVSGSMGVARKRVYTLAIGLGE